MTFFANDFSVSMSARHYMGGSTVAYPGYHDNLTADQEATLNPMGIDTIMETPSDSGEFVKVVSSDAGDIGDVIVCSVLDASGLEALGLAILNGATPVDLMNITNTAPLSVSRINSVVNRSNSRTPTSGDVTVTNVAGDVVYNGFKAADQRSFCLIFTTPADKMGIFLPAESTFNRSGNAGSNAVLRTKTRIKDGPWLNNGRWGLQRDGNSAFLFESADRPYIPPFTDITITAEVSNNGTDVTGRVPIYLMPAEFYKG